MTEQKPIGYFFINDYGNWEQGTGTDGTPLYEHPAPDIADLIEVLNGVVALSEEALDHWDKDRDLKVGKSLASLSGRLKKYDQRATQLHQLISKLEGKK